MADNAEGSGDAQITFKVKTGGDKTHTLTLPETTTVLDLKTKLAGADLENIPAERQRLIYSGRVMKNDDAISVYKIKPNNTIHMVKSAASNPTPQPSGAATGSTPTPAAVPQNMASGVANNPLAGLTGARYAGHVNLPSRDMFGADGGMGAPPSDEQMAQMLSDPSMMQSMNAALDNPQFLDFMIQSNPQLRNMPNAREVLQSPFMRQMMTNPDMLRSVMRMQRSMMGGQGNSAFPAPGATDSTPGDAAASGNNPAGGNNASNPFMPFGPPNPEMMNMMMGQMFGQGAGGAATGTGTGTTGENRSASATAGAGTTGGAAAGTDNASSQSPPPANPFAALFGAPPGGAQAGQEGAGLGANPFMNPEAMQQMMALLGGGGAGSPAAPPDNRPPEERYADQLRQLNDMGFFDFDRNIAALRRSGGSVQGAVEYLLSQ